MKRVTITLDEDVGLWLALAAKGGKRSYSNLIRTCLREFMESNPNRFMTADKARSPSETAWLVKPNFDV